jgi:GntR family transcriptional regulator
VGAVPVSESPVPPWRQIVAILAERIADGSYPPGSRMPSLTDMAAEFEVATSTIQKATGELRRRGLIVTSVMGTFVAEER